MLKDRDMITRFDKSDLKALDGVIEHGQTGPWNSATMKIKVLSYNIETGKARVLFVENPRMIGTGFEQEHNDWVNATWYVPLQLVLNAYFF